MNKFNIFVILLVSCLSYNDSDGAYYRSRNANNRLHSLSAQSARTLFVRRTFGRTPFGKPPLRNRFRNYFRVHTPAPWLRQKNKKIPEVQTELPKNPNSSLSVFGFIKEGQNNATLVNGTKWKWIARVMPTNKYPAPMICTAACITDRIFITAAICIYKSKLVYTRVFYQDQELRPIAFVLPSNQTKEMFDDVGLIVVDNAFNGTWYHNKVSPQWFRLGRPDNQFLWHAKKENYGAWFQALVIGYVSNVEYAEYTESESAAIRKQETVKFYLYQLEVYVSNFLCNYLYTKEAPNDAFFVPCYSPCNLTEHLQNLPKCYKHLSGLGHIIVWMDTKTIIGVSTWAGYYRSGIENPPLPTGLSIANSAMFKEDLACAEKIRDAPNTTEKFVTICKTP